MCVSKNLRKNEFLLEAQYVGLGMNVFSVIQGEYVVEELSVSEGRLHLFDNGKEANWDLFNSSEGVSTSVGLDRVELQNLALTYFAPADGIDYTCYANSAVLSGVIDESITLSGRVDLIENELRLDRELWVREASGAFAFNSGANNWEISSSKINVNGGSLSGSLNQDGVNWH